MLIFKVLLLIKLQVSLCERIVENINVCMDAEIFDFSNSCREKEPGCIEAIDYLKNFQDFDDFYIHFNGKVYHALNDVIYHQLCEIASSIWVPSSIKNCSKDIPVTFIDSQGKNQTGFLTSYEVIRYSTPSDSPFHCKNKDMRYTLPSGKIQIIRNENNLVFHTLSSIGKGFEILDKELKNNSFIILYNNIKNNTFFLLSKDFILLFVFMFAFLSKKELFVYMFNFLFKKINCDLFQFSNKNIEKKAPEYAPKASKFDGQSVIMTMEANQHQNSHQNTDYIQKLKNGSISYQEMQSKLKSMQIKASGTKAVLQDRLLDALS